MGKSGKLFKALVSGVKAFKSPSKERQEKEKSASKADKDHTRKGSKEKCLWSLGKSSSRNRDSLAAAASFLDAPEIKSVQVENLHVKDVPLTAHSCAAKPGYGPKGPSKAEDESHTDRVPMSRMEEFKQEELAAIKIQAAIRRYLALQLVSRALRALVRLQALARGRMVRKRASTALRCMQALVKVQALARGWRVRSSELGQLIQRHLQQTRQQKKKPVEGWVNSMGTLQQLQAKAQSKQDAVMKRQRALVYAFSEQLNRCTPKQSSSSAIEYQPDKSDWGWVWLERWMAARPWGNPPGVSKEQHNKNKAVDFINSDPEIYAGFSEKEILPLKEPVNPNNETASFTEYVDDILSPSQELAKEGAETFWVAEMREEQVKILTDVENAKIENKSASEFAIVDNASVNTKVVQRPLPSPPPPPPPPPPLSVNRKVVQRPLPSPPPPPPPPPPNANRAKSLVAHQKGSPKGQQAAIAASTYPETSVVFEAPHPTSSARTTELQVETFSSTLFTTHLKSSCAIEAALPDVPGSLTMDSTSSPPDIQPIEAFISPSTPFPEPPLCSIQSAPTTSSIMPENGGISQAQCDEVNVSMPMPSISDFSPKSLLPSQPSSSPIHFFELLALPPQEHATVCPPLAVPDVTYDELSNGAYMPGGNGANDGSITSAEELVHGLNEVESAINIQERHGLNDGETAMNVQEHGCMDSKTNKTSQGEVDMDTEELGFIDSKNEQAIEVELSSEANGGCDASIVSTGENPIEVSSSKHTSSSISRQGQIIESVSPSVPNYMSTTKSSKAKVRSLTSPVQKSDSPKQNSPRPRFDASKQKLDSPKQRLNSPKQNLDSPKQKSGSPKQKFDSPKQTPDSAIKRRHSLSAVEGKGSPGTTQKVTHVLRTSNKGQLASLKDTSTEHSPRSNGDSRRHGK
eukprot:c25062_g3_i2 orf=635-3385(-)